jgi:hypothetical protein
MQKEGKVEDNQMLGVFLIETCVTSKLITQENANELSRIKFKILSLSIPILLYVTTQ